MVKKYRNVGYNRAALAFIEAGGNNTKNLRCKAVDAVIAISPEDKRLFPCYYFAKSGVLIVGKLYDLFRLPIEVIKIPLILRTAVTL